MVKRHWKLVAVMVLVGAMLCAGAYAKKSKKKAKRASAVKGGEVERKVTKSEVPKAALATLKKLARGAKITEYAEEIEFGHTFYEGSWKARSGANVDVLVTKAGALVEIEERVDTDKVPKAVSKMARKAAGKGAQLAFEKKTMILYEIKFRKGDSRHELLLTPDGRCIEKEVDKGDPDEGDEDNDKDKKKTKQKIKTKSKDHDDKDDEGDDDEDEDEDHRDKKMKTKSKGNDDEDEDDDDEDEDADDEDEDDDDEDEDDDDEDEDDDDEDEEDDDEDEDDDDEDDED
ncbi:MAG: hypothetical protein ACYS6W_03785 [Planctomycetota bacterium]|jgi:hypothetical protein